MGLFKADTVNEEDLERDCATRVSETRTWDVWTAGLPRGRCVKRASTLAETRPSELRSCGTRDPYPSMLLCC